MFPFHFYAMTARLMHSRDLDDLRAALTDKDKPLTGTK